MQFKGSKNTRQQIYSTIRWLGEEGYSAINIEFDYKQVVDALEGSDPPNNELCCILTKCKKELLQIPNFKISFIWRQANQPKLFQTIWRFRSNLKNLASNYT